MDDQLSTEERLILLQLARQALESGVRRQPRGALDLDSLPERLREPGATFVTLTEREMLRGCVGALEAYQPLAEDVREHTVTAALEDYRFPPVSPEEVPRIKIEISRLTAPKPLEYDKPEDLLKLLRPGIDGVVLREGLRRATFLPQVWEKLPDPREFLAHLCLKMGVDANYWRYHKLQVYTYQVEEFHE
jgi:AmmeMemoRadiSam system protein A